MKTETLKRIISILDNVASSDETRTTLQHCRIDKTHITAIDGHIMCHYEHNDEFFLPLESPLFIHKDTVDMLEVILKQHRKRHTVPEAMIEENYLYVGAIKLSADVSNFPNHKQFLMEYGTELRVGFDVKLLESIVKAMKDKNSIVTLTFAQSMDKEGKLAALDALRPINVTCNGQRGVLMPCRI